jgi:hypothetical protein
MNNHVFEQIEYDLLHYISQFEGSGLERIFRDLLDKLRTGIAISQADIDAAMDASLRGGEFSGDQVGRPADDFD